MIENGTKGFTVGRAEHKMGQHASVTNELIFEDCRVPKSAMMGKPNDGFRIAVGELAGGRIGIGSLGLGIGQAAIEYAAKYALERKQFDQSITNFQAIQWMIAESYTELEAARLLLMNAAFKKRTAGSLPDRLPWPNTTPRKRRRGPVTMPFRSWEAMDTPRNSLSSGLPATFGSPPFTRELNRI